MLYFLVRFGATEQMRTLIIGKFAVELALYKAETYTTRRGLI
jgi:hypothetical protein